MVVSFNSFLRRQSHGQTGLPSKFQTSPQRKKEKETKQQEKPMLLGVSSFLPELILSLNSSA